MNKTTMLVVAGLLMIGLVASAGIASAFGGRYGGCGFSDAREAIRQAVENNDYGAWKYAMSGTMTEEKFNKIVERHESRSEKRQLINEQREALTQALETEDYNVWKNVIDSFERTPGIAGKITEENFDTFVKLHEARQNRDYETVKALREELGFDKEHCMHGMRAQFRNK